MKEFENIQLKYKYMAIQQWQNWANRNKEHLKKYHSEYRKSASGIYTSLKKTLKLKSGVKELTINREDFIKWYKSQNKKCVYCGIKEEGLSKDIIQSKRFNKRLTIDRINNDIGYRINNIILACHKCNQIKNNLFTYNEMLQIGKIINRKRKAL